MIKYKCVYRDHAETKRNLIKENPHTYNGLLECLGCDGFDNKCDNYQRRYYSSKLEVGADAEL